MFLTIWGIFLLEKRKCKKIKIKKIKKWRIVLTKTFLGFFLIHTPKGLTEGNGGDWRERKWLKGKKVTEGNGSDWRERKWLKGKEVTEGNTTCNVLLFEMCKLKCWTWWFRNRSVWWNSHWLSNQHLTDAPSHFSAEPPFLTKFPYQDRKPYYQVFPCA